MDDYSNGASSIRGFDSAALELNGHKCAICYSGQCRQLVDIDSVETALSGTILNELNVSDYFDIKFRRVCCLQSSDSIFS